MMRSKVTLFFITVVLFGCHTDVIKEPRPIDLVLSKIGGTWNVTNVVLGGVRKLDYEKGSVAFLESQNSDLIYFITDGMPTGEYWPWPGSGTLKIGESLQSSLIFVEVNEWFEYFVDDSQLQVTLPDRTPCIPKEGEVCVEVRGQWRFTLTREN